MTEEETQTEMEATETEDSMELAEELKDGPVPERKEEATEFPTEIEVKSGDINPLDLEKLRPLCMEAEKTYQTVLEHIKAIRGANVVLHKFHAGDGSVTEADVEKAKSEFHDAKQAYIQIGNQINEGIKPLYVMAKSHPNDTLVQTLYATYLAKLLVCLETRNQIEPYVRRLAQWAFVFEREKITLSDEEERRNITIESKMASRLEAAKKEVRRLESRYQKRQVQIRLRGGENPTQIINQLMRVGRQDPEDIHTFIWLAQLMSEHLLPRQRDQNRRLEIRDDILQNCQKAFSQIDDFLNLQGMQNQAERDRRRSEYLKTITSIRKPLLKGI